MDPTAPRIAIVGSGPTGLYALLHLLRSPRPLDLTLLEEQDEAGWGMPYAPELNGAALLANIASLEIPPILDTLAGWLGAQPDATLARLGLERAAAEDERAYHPRVVLGEFLRAQLAGLVERARAAGHRVEVLERHHVADIALRADDVALTVERGDGERVQMGFDRVIAATGHTLSDAVETRPGWFASPYPTSALRAVRPVAVGIRGSSLSAIDAVVALAQAHGVFLRDTGGRLDWHAKPGTEGLSITMLSRKGLLPPADFFYPFPHPANRVCTAEAVLAEAAAGPVGLLDRVFALFAQELALADPEGAAALVMAGPDGFSAAWFAGREDAFAWAARDFAEAVASHETRTAPPLREAVLRTHEAVELCVPHLLASDLERFHRGWKAAFVDDYAAVPHESVERLLALRRAGVLELLRVGKDYRVEAAGDGPGAVLEWEGGRRRFAAFVEATGQESLDAEDLPFPSLRAQGAVREARAAKGGWDEDDTVAVGGVELDEAFRPVNALPLHRGLHLLALPFLLHLRPFHQGLTGAEELGRTVAEAILAELGAEALAA